jgi:hypothetical protein
MSFRLSTGVWIILFALTSGCNQPFDPRAPYEPQLVVFSIISNDRNAQFVRLHSSYMPPGFNPNEFTSDNSITGATVILSGGGKTYSLRDTLLARLDSSRYNFPIHLYAAAPLVPQRGQPYTLSIQTPSAGSATATATVPSKAVLSMDAFTQNTLYYPEKHSVDSDILLSVILDPKTQGYIGRFFVYYDVLKGADWYEERAEIPLTSADTGSYGLVAAQYPDLTARTSSNSTIVRFKNGYYLSVIKQITFQRYTTTQLIYKWAVLVFLQADKNVYNYYSQIHAFRDPRSIRLDEPMFTNVAGGIGVVGAYSLDSLVFYLPQQFVGNR